VSFIAKPNPRTEFPYAAGYTHALVMEFENKEDWLYYTKEDPVHTEFIQTNEDWKKGLVIVSENEHGGGR
jgi:hypothetical protein